jgi:trehalose transport system permease protein
LLTVAVANAWKVTPLVMLILLAGLQAISREAYEATRTDGANAGQQFWWITLPLPDLAVGGLLAWLFSGEEFILATYFTLVERTMPLQVCYYLYQGNWFVTAVAAAIMTVPVLLLSTFPQPYLQKTSFTGATR